MADTLEWVDEALGSPITWRLMDCRAGYGPDCRAMVRGSLRIDVVFYPIYRGMKMCLLPKPEGMSIDQLKEWARNQFLLLRES